LSANPSRALCGLPPLMQENHEVVSFRLGEQSVPCQVQSRLSVQLIRPVLLKAYLNLSEM